MIHHTAKIHRSAIIEGDVEIGEGAEIGALCYIEGPVSIGARTKIFPHCVIGTPPEHRSLPGIGRIVIGNDNIIREFTCIQRGTGDRETTIGNNCFIMDHVHIAHDCHVENDVTIAPNTVLAGHVYIYHSVNLGVGVQLHQHSSVGAYAMVGMGATVTKDIPPFCLVMGSPAKYRRLNMHKCKVLDLLEKDFSIIDGRLCGLHDRNRDLFTMFYEKKRRECIIIDNI